jgi:hypothetical protein
MVMRKIREEKKKKNITGGRQALPVDVCCRPLICSDDKSTAGALCLCLAFASAPQKF